MLGREKTILYSFIILLLACPLPLGSNRPWSWSILAMAAGILTLWLGVLMVKDSSKSLFPSGVFWWVVAPFLLVLAWSAAQAYLPPPEGWEDPLWSQTAAALEEPVAPWMSLDPAATRTALMRLAAYGALFYLSLTLCRRHSRARRLYSWITAGAVAYSLYGIIIYLSGARMILWYKQEELARYFEDDVVSTFLNHNHFATYAGLGLVCLLGLTADRIPRLLSSVGESAQISSEETGDLGVNVIVISLAFAILVSAIVLSHSRAGLIFTLLAVALYLLIFVLSSRWALAIRAGLAVALAGLTALVYMVGGYGFEKRMERLEESGVLRFAIYEITEEGIAFRPWSGVGHGAYIHSIKRHKNIGLYHQIDQAHNVYLETAMELGVPVSLALLAAFLAMFVILLRGVFRRGRGRVFSAVGLCAMALVGTHSLFEFSMQIPAVAATFSAIAGAACARSFSSRQS